MVLLFGGMFNHKIFILRWSRGTAGEYLSDAALLFRRRDHFQNRNAATDPTSASPGRINAYIAISCFCKCANSVPTASTETLAERGRESRRPFCE
jgi:hypothetical protein